MGLEPVPTAAALILQELIVEGEPTDEDSDVGACQPVNGNAAIFERLPGDLQQQALLGIEGVGLAR